MSAPSIAAIQRAVCQHYDISIERMLCHRRSRKWARPRQIAMYLAHEMTDFSPSQIARAFNRDHSTILFGIDRIKEMRSKESAISSDIDRIEAGVRIDNKDTVGNWDSILYSDYGAGLLE